VNHSGFPRSLVSSRVVCGDVMDERVGELMDAEHDLGSDV
jgi:hypothetical protein